MASPMESRINDFLELHDLTDKISVDEICEVFNSCASDFFKIFMAKIPDESTAETIELAKSRDDLNKCNTKVLDQYIKDNSLKMSGNKKDKMDRIWRHLQGSSLDSDTSIVSKSSKDKKSKKNNNICCATTAKKTPCTTSGTEEYQGHWFCWRHVDTKDEIIKKMSKIEDDTVITKKKHILTKKDLEEVFGPESEVESEQDDE